MPRTKKTITTTKAKKEKEELEHKNRTFSGKEPENLEVKLTKDKQPAEIDAKEPEQEIEIKETDRYYEGIGRRKTAIARARIWTKGDKKITVNGKSLSGYFPTLELQKTAIASLEKMKCLEKFGASVVVKGGGMSAQAEAMRHGLARALMLFNPEFRKRLKKAGFLKRDSRMKERKKPGLRKARRAPQWGKR